jgi:hypothetical protein
MSISFHGNEIVKVMGYSSVENGFIGKVGLILEPFLFLLRFLTSTIITELVTLLFVLITDYIVVSSG